MTYRKIDDRTNHEKWCDLMIERSRSQRVRSVRVGRTVDRQLSYNYTNYELRELLKNA